MLGIVIVTGLAGCLGPGEVEQDGAPRVVQWRRDGVVAVLHDGRVLVAGGDGPLATAEVYDPAAGQWSAVAPLSHGRARATATVLVDGRVLVAGGTDCGVGTCTGANSVHSAELFDPETGTWTPTGEMMAGRERHAAALLSDGRVLVAGGNGVEPGDPEPKPGWGKTLRSVEIYDPATGRWSTQTPMHLARYGAFGFTDVGNAMVVGGETFNADWRNAAREAIRTGEQTRATLERFDVQTGEWALSTEGPTELGFEPWATRLADGRVLHLTGPDRDKAMIWHPETDVWLILQVVGGSAPIGMSHLRDTLAMIQMADGRVLASGGGLPPTSRAASVFLPLTATWSVTGDMNMPRREHTAALLHSGEVLVFGGVDAEKPGYPEGWHQAARVMTSEVYDPATGTWAAR